MFDNTTILITGGTGSIGKVIAKYLINKYNVNKIIIFSRDEYKQFKMKNDKNIAQEKLEYIIGDIKDYNSINSALYNVDYIFHTAALKHVDICEENPSEAINVNVLGSLNLINASINNNVKKVLFFSSDKANNPFNTYGSSKLLADKLCINANKYNKTKFSVLRMGNIFGSKGSIIEKFMNNETNIYDLTNYNIHRIFILWKEVIEILEDIFEIFIGGEIFIPITKNMYIRDIIFAINENADLRITGLRDGDRFEENLISNDEINNTIKYKDKICIILSKWCKNYYQQYEKISKNNIMDNKVFYDIEEIKKILNDNKLFI